MTAIHYTPPKTCKAFMRSDAFGRIILGPVGSGKTTAIIFELFRRACEQKPAQDGVRYTRFAITRTTLQQMRDTILKDALAWFREIAEWKVSLSCCHLWQDAADVFLLHSRGDAHGSAG
jgi:Ni2+-binding GTPase involved in maturation of urease and hydrogenase